MSYVNDDERQEGYSYEEDSCYESFNLNGIWKTEIYFNIYNIHKSVDIPK